MPLSPDEDDRGLYPRKPSHIVRQPHVEFTVLAALLAHRPFRISLGTPST